MSDEQDRPDQDDDQGQEYFQQDQGSDEEREEENNNLGVPEDSGWQGDSLDEQDPEHEGGENEDKDREHGAKSFRHAYWQNGAICQDCGYEKPQGLGRRVWVPSCVDSLWKLEREQEQVRAYMVAA